MIDHYEAEVISANDYYPFGMMMPGREYSASSSYRYGFNGKENDNEVKGEGNQQDYGFRIYDPRIGRFLSADPIRSEYPELTSYQFASNSPIAHVDLDGLEAWAVNPSTGQVLSGPLDHTRLRQQGYITGNYVTPVKFPAPQTQNRPVLGNNSESTCQGCASRNQQIAMATAPATAKRKANVSQARKAPASMGVSTAYGKKVDPYVNMIRQDRIERESEREGDIFPFVGSVIQGFRRLGNDDARGATSSFGRFGFEAAASAVPFLRFSRGPRYLYHYTSQNAAQSISQQGLKVGRDGFSYLTNKGNLSPLQAQIELALPANRALPTSILRINVSGFNPTLIRRVSGNIPGYGAGGGMEFLFNQSIPANLIKVIKL